MKKSNIPYYEEEREVILAMSVKGGVGTAFYTKLTAREINELETLIEIKRGDKITQLVVMKIDIPELNVVDEFKETERGNGGFGSTGR